MRIALPKAGLASPAACGDYGNFGNFRASSSNPLSWVAPYSYAFVQGE